MRITRKQLRQIILEELSLEGRRKKVSEPTEREKAEALVAESPDTRAMGEYEFKGNLNGARDGAAQRAREKLGDPAARMIGGGVGPDEAYEKDVYFAVVEKN